MMKYIEELRTAQQNAEENLIHKEAELEEVRDRLGSKAPGEGATAADGRGLDGEVRLLVEMLRNIAKDSEQVSMSRILSGGELVQTGAMAYRADKLQILESLRQVAVDLQKLKIERLKALEGNMELRKDFIKSMRPMQSRLDDLMNFNQGLLNGKEAGCVPAAAPFYINRNSRV